MRKRKILICLSLALLFVFIFTGTSFANDSYPDQKVSQSIKKAVSYLHKYQNDDGGFSSKKGGPSSRALTSWVVMAIVAAGEDVTGSAWEPSGKNPIDYLKNCNKELEETCDYARLLLSLTAAKQGTMYRGIDLAAKIASFQQESGQFFQPAWNEHGMINSHMWSILALASAGYDIPDKDKAKKWLLKHQNEDGGFGWVEGTYSDTDDTGVAIQALVMLGEDPATSSAIKKALKYLKDCQQKDGGFSCGNDWMGNESNSASDAWVLQGLLAAGENPVSEKWSVNGKNPLSHLLSLQNNDGSFNWKEGVTSSPVKMTAFAIMALAGKPHPVNIDYCGKSMFSDLSSSHWAYASIVKLVNAKVLSGYPDGTFKPDKSVTRAEFTKFMVCGLGLENVVSYSAGKFPDVPQGHWARKYISIAVDKEYVKGRPGGRFDPNGKITGAELATMLVRALPPEKKSQMTEGPYWYSGNVKLARENGLLYPGFQAGENATRAQCAYSIVRLKNLRDSI